MPSDHPLAGLPASHALEILEDVVRKGDSIGRLADELVEKHEWPHEILAAGSHSSALASVGSSMTPGSLLRRHQSRPQVARTDPGDRFSTARGAKKPQSSRFAPLEEARSRSAA